MSNPGRPEFEPTADQREEVERLMYCGMAEQMIAAAMGISLPTLRKYFAQELLNGRANKKAELQEMLWTAARAGNVSAMRKLHDLDQIQPQKEAKPPEVGKKEAAQLAAETSSVGTGWADLLPN